MEKFKTFILERKLALIISLVYVGLGTLSVCSLYPDDKFYGDFTSLLFAITFPVSIISFSYRFAVSDPLYPVFIIQTVMFILSFLILGYFSKNRV